MRSRQVDLNPFKNQRLLEFANFQFAFKQFKYLCLRYSKKKTVELFEPHGARDNKSELESISRAYFKVSKNVHKFVRNYLPGFKYIDIEVDTYKYLKKLENSSTYYHYTKSL